MSEYRRFVSYMYLYEHNVKSMNAGFVKVESRGGNCCINLSLKNVYSSSGKCQAYLFLRVGQELRGIYIGEIQIYNHGSEWVFRTEAENIADSGYGLDQMSGMIIRGENEKYYATLWDQGELDLNEFVTEWSEETELTDIAEIHVEEMNSAQEMVEVEMEQKAEISKESLDDSLVPVDARQQSFQKMLEQCPGMYPFEDDGIESCVRLEPQDIGQMPLDCWSYGSNSFLLHGYYSYRHLILAKLKTEDNVKENYILGVPGTQHSRDAFMANMFGFHNFKPIREGEESANNFGYWYTHL